MTTVKSMMPTPSAILLIAAKELINRYPVETAVAVLKVGAFAYVKYHKVKLESAIQLERVKLKLNNLKK